MRRRSLVAWGLILAGALAACNLPAVSAPQPMVETGEGSEGTYPPGTSTGRADLDRVVEAALSEDPRAVVDLVAFTSTACANAEGLGGPPKCRDGEPDGTPVEVLPFLEAEGHFLRRDELPEWTGLEVTGLLAVYRVSAEAYSDRDYPSGEWAIVLANRPDGMWVTLHITDGRIVRIDQAMGPSDDVRIEQQVEEWLLPPASGAP